MAQKKGNPQRKTAKPMPAAPAKKRKMMSDYQAFIKSQISLGKTFNQAVKEWRSEKWHQRMRKSGNLGAAIARGKTLARYSKKMRAAKAGARTARARTAAQKIVSKKAAVKKASAKRTRARNARAKEARARKESAKRVPRTRTVQKTVVRRVPVGISSARLEELIKSVRVPSAEPQEDAALRIVELYFSHMARYGVKRNVDVDLLVDTYQHVRDKLNVPRGK